MSIDLNFIFIYLIIIEEQGVEKIKTIGDSYDCIRVPNNDDNHAKNVLNWSQMISFEDK